MLVKYIRGNEGLEKEIKIKSITQLGIVFEEYKNFDYQIAFDILDCLLDYQIDNFDSRFNPFYKIQNCFISIYLSSLMNKSKKARLTFNKISEMLKRNLEHIFLTKKKFITEFMNTNKFLEIKEKYNNCLNNI